MIEPQEPRLPGVNLAGLDGGFPVDFLFWTLLPREAFGVTGD